MSLKYRIRLSENRVIGPFSKEEIAELYEKKHINGTEDCQLFPVGAWKGIQSIASLEEIFVKKMDPEPSPKIESASSSFQEFKFSKQEQEHVNYSELEKKYQDLNEEKREETSADVKEVPELEKTRILKLKQSQEIEKTVIDINKASIRVKEEPTPNIEVQAPTEEKAIVVKSLEEQLQEKTQFIDIKSVLPSINTELRAAEIDFEQQENLEENQERIQKREQDKKPEKAEEAKVNKKKKVGMKPIVAIAFLAIIYVLLNPDEAPVASGPLFTQINFPLTQEFEDASKASLALQKGRESYASNTYLGRVAAAQQYVDSLQNQFRSNEAIGELILTYSELLENSKDEKRAANVIYKLVLLAENKTFSDVKVVTGTALFYYKIEKYQAGINLVKNFFRAKGKPTPKLLAYYLDLLIGAGDFPEATKIAVKLNETQKKPYEAYLSLAHYYETNEQAEEGKKIIEEGLKLYPKSVPLLLRLADFLLKEKQLDKFQEVLVKCSKLNSESSPAYTAKYFKHMGFLSAIKNKNKEAATFFKKSLAIQESDDLRAVLANLEIKGDKFAQALILESKIIELMKKADVEIKNRNFEAAAAFSVEAVDADPDYVPAVMQHVRIQLERGLYDAAIHSLTRILEKQPLNIQVKKMLIETDLRALKFDDAQKGLVELGKTKFGLTSGFASLMAKFFEGKKINHLAIRWYAEALSRYPLSDIDMYNLAKIYFKTRKFDEAKKHLGKALTLDPKNVEYVALQAEILADQDSADVALGYLRDSMVELGEDPLLVSTIAKTYYKSGQLKEFQNYYKKILEMPKKDEKFFEFLIYAAKLEDSKNDFVTYSNELLKINPGNLSLRMELAEFYIRNGNLEEALVHLKLIEEMLKSYPRLHFLFSKIAFLKNDFARAKEMAEKEKTYNPTLEQSFYMLGEVARAQKDFREAIVQYEKALSLNPKSVDTLLAIATIKLGQNHSNEALDLLLLANKYDKNNPEIFKQLGFAYRASGQRSLGKDHFEAYLKLNPGATDRAQIESIIESLK